MKGTILDFLKLANETPELAGALVQLAAKYDFEFSDEVSDEALQDVAGGFLERFPNVPLTKEPPRNKSMDREGTIE